MGRYIKKSKLAGDVSLKDISHPTTYNFRTRAAKNLTLQRLRSHSVSPSVDDVDSFHYLQLRSRRLVKLPLLADTKKQQLKQLVHGIHKSQTRSRRAKLERYESETTVVVTEKDEDCGNNVGKSEFDCNFGETGFDFESRDSLRGDSEAIQSIPSSREIEEFFAYAEEQQHRFFNEKYNFDIVSKNPLPGRYEWTKVVL